VALELILGKDKMPLTAFFISTHFTLDNMEYFSGVYRLTSLAWFGNLPT
jgi:hypothetical protein